LFSSVFDVKLKGLRKKMLLSKYYIASILIPTAIKSSENNNALFLSYLRAKFKMKSSSQL